MYQKISVTEVSQWVVNHGHSGRREIEGVREGVRKGMEEREERRVGRGEGDKKERKRKMERGWEGRERGREKKNILTKTEMTAVIIHVPVLEVTGHHP